MAAPVFTTVNFTTFQVGVSGSFSVAVSGSPTSTFSILVGGSGAPAGVTFTDNHNNTASVHGLPAANTGGMYINNIQAANGTLPNAIQSFTLTVNQPPAITSTNSVTLINGTVVNFTITTTGFPKPSLSFTGTLPSGVNFTDQGNGTAKLTGTPNDVSGSFPIVVTAANGVNPNATQTLTITLVAAPVFTNSNNLPATVGVPLNLTVSVTSSPTATIAFQGSLPSPFTFVDNGNNTATIGGTLPANGGAAYTGTIKATNIYGSTLQTLTVTVAQLPTFITPPALSMTQNQSFFGTVQADGFPIPSLAESGVLPSGISFADRLNGTCSLSGTPTIAGTFPTTFTATNTAGTAVSNTIITVNASASYVVTWLNAQVQLGYTSIDLDLIDNSGIYPHVRQSFVFHTNQLTLPYANDPFLAAVANKWISLTIANYNQQQQQQTTPSNVLSTVFGTAVTSMQNTLLLRPPDQYTVDLTNRFNQVENILLN